MSIDDLKQEIGSLPDDSLSELIVHAIHLKRLRDPETIKELDRRRNDMDPSHKVTLQEFEALLKSH